MPDRQPRVFLSFAGPDRPVAEKFRGALAERGFGAFVDVCSIEPGENVLIAINRALTESSYFVLLWSRHTSDRPWVDLEWTAALARELNTRRAFLFVLRLDESEVPLILTARKYLDAYPDWEAALARLTDSWRRDRDLDPHVFPAPVAPEAGQPADGLMIELYIHNQALSVSHVVRVLHNVTGPELYAHVGAELDLRESVAKFGGVLTARFTYQLSHHGQPLPDQPLPDQPLTPLGLEDGATVDLLVQGEFESHGQIVGTWTFRTGTSPAHPAISPQAMRALIDAAFGHLKP
jgi:hypothetical protein